MGNGKFIVIAGDVMLDRNWLVTRPPAGTSQQHADVPAWKMLDAAYKPDVLGGAGIIARAVFSADAKRRACLLGGWKEDFDPAKAVPEYDIEGLNKRKNNLPIRFVRFANTDFNTEKLRVYELSSGKTKLCWRFDRDLARKSAYKINLNINAKKKVVEECPPAANEVAAVIVGDFDKGFLDLPEVREQLCKYRCPTFLLRSKRDLKDELFDKLPWTVLLPDREDLARWVGTKNPSATYVKQSGADYSLHPELITSLQQLAKRFEEKKDGWAILVKLDREGAVLLSKDGKIVLFSVPEQSRGPLAGIGAGDVLMANLAPLLADAGHDKGKVNDAYRDSIEAATAYCHAAENIRENIGEITWYATNTYVDKKKKEKIKVLPVEDIEELGKLSKKWDSARNIVKLLKDKKVEVRLQDAKWYLEDFLTVNTEMGNEIARIRSEITQYINSDEKKPFVTGLCGAPGSGKSTLAKALRKALKCVFVESNAAQWTSVEDMFLICERIRSARISGDLPLAFIDEVDSKLGGEHWYARLLAPVWDGEYSLSGEIRKLGPVVFLLAGSDEHWRTAKTLTMAKKDKLPDLVSRFTVKPVQIESLDSAAGHSDAVYLAAFQFQLRFSSMGKINSRVLDLFAKSKFHFGSRSVTQVVKLFGPLQDPTRVSVGDFRGKTEGLKTHVKKLPARFATNWKDRPTWVNIQQ